MKKTITFILVLAMALSLSAAVFAAEVDEESASLFLCDELTANTDREREVDALLSELALLNIKADVEHTDVEPDELEKINQRISDIENELADLGTTKVTKEFVEKLNVNTEIETNSIYASIPWDPYPGEGGDNEFYVSGPNSYTYNGRTYHYVVLSVIPQSTDSLLTTHNIIEVEGISALSSFANKVLKLFVSKVASALADELKISLTPFEILFGDWSDSQVRSTSSDYIINSDVGVTAKYVYVCDPSDDWTNQYNYYLTLLTHSVSIADTHTFTKYENGKPIHYSFDRNVTHNYDYFLTAGSRAITNFCSNKYYEIISPEDVYYTWKEDSNVVRREKVPEGYYNPDFM